MIYRRNPDGTLEVRADLHIDGIGVDRVVTDQGDELTLAEILREYQRGDDTVVGPVRITVAPL